MDYSTRGAYGAFKRQVRQSPAGQDLRARELAELVESAGDVLVQGLLSMGLAARQSGALADLEAALFGYACECNPQLLDDPNAGPDPARALAAGMRAPMTPRQLAAFNAWSR